jgi:hypothetical protein
LGIGKQPPISQGATSLTGALTKGTIGEAVFGKAFTWTAEATAQWVAQGATFAATQTVIEFGGKVAMKFASDDFENWAGAQGGKLTNPTELTNPTGGDEYASIGWKDSSPMLAWKESETAPPWNPQDYPEAIVPQGKFQNPALDLIWSVGEAAKEMTTDREAQGRITAAFGLGFAFGFGKTVVSSDAIQGGIAKAKALPGRYMDATYQVLGGGRGCSRPNVRLCRK